MTPHVWVIGIKSASQKAFYKCRRCGLVTKTSRTKPPDPFRLDPWSVSCEDRIVAQVMES